MIAAKNSNHACSIYYMRPTALLQIHCVLEVNCNTSPSSVISHLYQSLKMAFLLRIAFLTSLFLPVLSVDQPLHVVVDGKHGHDTPQCLRSSSFPCRSLSFVARNLTQNNSVEIEIFSELLNLRVPVEFTNYTNLTITGSGRDTTIHCNEPEAGLAFMSVQNLNISSLTIENCGALRNSTSVNPLKPNETEKLNVAV